MPNDTPTARYDLDLARKNIDVEIEGLEAQIAKLKENQKLLKNQGEGLFQLFDLVRQYGKTPKSPAVALGGDFIPSPDNSMKDNVAGIITAAPQPVRSDYVVAVFQAAGMKIIQSGLYSSLKANVEAHRIKKISNGLYWRTKGGNASAGKGGIGTLSGGDNMKDALADIFKAANGGPMTAREAVTALDAKGFNWGKRKSQSRRITVTSQCILKELGGKGSGPKNFRRVYSVSE